MRLRKFSSVETASNFVTGGEADYLQGIAKLGERMVMLLDLDQALGTGILAGEAAKIG
jgi:chemotaxis signal transduction protein